MWAAWEGSSYLRNYRELKVTQYETLEQTQSRQMRALVSLLCHAYETVPFYRQRFNEAGFHPRSFQAFTDLGGIPILTKRDIREAGPLLLSDAYANNSNVRRKATSGSTGVSLRVIVDEAAMQFKRACTLRSDEWSGWRFGEPVAMLWGNPDYLKRGWRGRLRNAVLERGNYLDTLKIDETTLQRFAESLVQRPPSLIFGHAHSVWLLSQYLKRHKPGVVRPKGIITSAMVLHEWQRSAIEAEFECKVTNRYGCEEVSLIACECEQHMGLHVNTDGQFVELVHNGRQVTADTPGSVIVTDLVNRAMPLIRYQVGDVATWANVNCLCGRFGMPLLSRLEGREADYVTTVRGELISGISLTENFAMHVPGIEQIQIVQESPEQFLFRIVRATDYSQKSDEAISKLVCERFGPEAHYQCEFVERIPQEPSGKYRFCISKVTNSFSAAGSSDLAIP